MLANNKQIVKRHKVNWLEKLNELLKKHNSIRKMALDIGLSHVYLSGVIKGSQPLSSKLKTKILINLGFEMAKPEVLVWLLDDQVIDEMLHAENIQKKCLTNDPYFAPGLPFSKEQVEADAVFARNNLRERLINHYKKNGNKEDIK